MVRRPDGKRPPLTNIAELTAGLLSHVDLDATDVTAALFLASAAQNRRRRLRIAKALLPVYKAIRSGAAGSSGGGSEEPLSSGEDGGWTGGSLSRAARRVVLSSHFKLSASHQRLGKLMIAPRSMRNCSCPGSTHAAELCLPFICAGGDDDASTTSSVNDVPTDAELDRMIAAQQAQRLQQQRQQQPGRPAQQGEADGEGADGQELPMPQLAPPATPPKPGRRGKTVSWAEDALAPAAAAAVARPAPTSSTPTASPQGPPDLSGISLPGPAMRQLRQEQEQGTARAAAVEPSADRIEASGSLPLTAVNVAGLDERLAAAEQLAAVQAGGEPPSTEQVGWVFSLVRRAGAQACWADCCGLAAGQTKLALSFCRSAVQSLVFNTLHLVCHPAVQVQQAEQLLEDLPASLPDQVRLGWDRFCMPFGCRVWQLKIQPASGLVIPRMPAIFCALHAGGGGPAGRCH